MRFFDVVSQYLLSERSVAVRAEVASPLIRKFTTQFRKLNRQLGDLEIDEEWTAILRRIRRTMRELISTPLSPADPFFRLKETSNFLNERLLRMTPAYGAEQIAQAKLCIETIDDLSHSVENPLGDCISEILSNVSSQKSALLTLSPHYEEIGKWLGDCCPWTPVIRKEGVSKLRELECLVIAGPSQWFPVHILSSPRAERIHFVHYDAVRDHQQSPFLLGNSNRSLGTLIQSSSPPMADLELGIDAALITSVVDWEALSRIVQRRSGSDQEPVSAGLFLLAGGFGVYLEATDGPRIDVVDFEGGPTPRLRAESTRSIEVGDFVVLRSEGGSGDYVPEIADMLIGGRAKEYRDLQRLWKTALRKIVASKTVAQVEREVRSLGVESPNLRYRLWSGSLRSEKPTDFRILMEYIGLGAQKDQIWNAMGLLAEAHLRAGQEVRRRLEEKLLSSNPEEIMRNGRLNVSLDGMNAGTLSVMRVEHRAPDPITLDEDQVRVMFQVDGDLWQG